MQVCPCRVTQPSRMGQQNVGPTLCMQSRLHSHVGPEAACAAERAQLRTWKSCLRWHQQWQHSRCHQCCKSVGRTFTSGNAARKRLMYSCGGIARCFCAAPAASVSVLAMGKPPVLLVMLDCRRGRHTRAAALSGRLSAEAPLHGRTAADPLARIQYVMPPDWTSWDRSVSTVEDCARSRPAARAAARPRACTAVVPGWRMCRPMRGPGRASSSARSVSSWLASHACSFHTCAPACSGHTRLPARARLAQACAEQEHVNYHRTLPPACLASVEKSRVGRHETDLVLCIWPPASTKSLACLQVPSHRCHACARAAPAARTWSPAPPSRRLCRPPGCRPAAGRSCCRARPCPRPPPQGSMAPHARPAPRSLAARRPARLLCSKRGARRAVGLRRVR